MNKGYGRTKSLKILFGSVVYRKAEKYLPAFFTSMNRQTKGNFSVLLINDDINSVELQKMVSRYSFEAEILHMPGRTPVQLRIELLKSAKYRQADLLIMGDSDDYFSDTRVKNIVDKYMEKPDSGFYYNELADIFGKKIMPELPKSIHRFEEIGEYNFLGLSNTALNMNKISCEFIDSLREYHGEIFDWYLFSRLLLEEIYGVKVDGCATIYRLHENNIAGIQDFNQQNINREIEVKRKHYNSLRKYDLYYEKKYDQYQHLKECERLANQTEHFWWNLLSCIEEGIDYE